MMLIIHIIVIFVVVFTIPARGPLYQRHFVNFPAFLWARFPLLSLVVAKLRLRSRS